MGWSSWNTFRDAVNEDLIVETADAMVANGMRDHGYRYVNIDAGWQASHRNPDGTLDADVQKFPHGMKQLADYLHKQGLKLGLYSSPGPQTCPKEHPYPGSEGHEAIDAQQYERWGVDYLKYDRCSHKIEGIEDAFLRMRQALDTTDRLILFSINPNDSAASNEHPELSVSTQHWSNVADLWRTTQDVKPIWSDRNEEWYSGMIDIADDNVEWTRFGSKGAWNDPDMLEIGVGPEVCAQDWHRSEACPLTAGEGRIQMALWSIMAAPLIAGNDVRCMDASTRTTLLNPEVIAVDQDPAGTPGWRVRDEGDIEVWMRPLQNPGSRAVALVNRSGSRQTITAFFSELRLANGAASVRDLLAHTDLGTMSSVTRSVASHDVAMFRVDGTDDLHMFEAESVHNERSGNRVSVASCPGCSGGLKLTHIGVDTSNGDSGAVLIPVDATATGNATLAIYYLSAVPRNLTIRVNGGVSTTHPIASSGGFQTVQRFPVTVPLNAGRNGIELYDLSGWAPDIDRVAVE